MATGVTTFARRDAAVRALGRPAAGVLLALAAALSRGEGSGMSPAFVFDARYEASGLSPELWAAEEGSDVSEPFTFSMLWLHVDSDGDGMPDAWEREHGLDPERDDSGEDPDGDGLTNLDEYASGSDPAVYDDQAAPPDAAWAKHVAVSRMFVTDTAIHRSGDGAFDPDSAIVRVSSAFVCDTTDGTAGDDADGDGIPDWWEALYSGSKTGFAASADDDGDGRTALEEYVSGTDPTDPDSFFAVSIAMDAPSAADGATGYTISWEAVQGRVYALYSKTSLDDAWPDDPIRVVEDASGTVALHFELDGPARFFKVEVSLAPAD